MTRAATAPSGSLIQSAGSASPSVEGSKTGIVSTTVERIIELRAGRAPVARQGSAASSSVLPAR